MDPWQELGLLQLLTLTFLASVFWEEAFVSKFMPAFYDFADMNGAFNKLKTRPIPSSRSRRAVHSSDEITVLLTMACQRLISAAGILAAERFESPLLFRMALFLQVGSEASDSARIVLRTWPYGNSKSHFRKRQLAYHMLGLLIYLSLPFTGADSDAHLRQVVSVVLLTEGLSMFIQGVTRTLLNNFSGKMTLIAFFQSVATVAFAYAWLYRVPVDLYELAQIRWASGAWTSYLCETLGCLVVCIGFSAMTMYRATLVHAHGRSAVKYARRAFNADNQRAESSKRKNKGRAQSMSEETPVNGKQTSKSHKPQLNEDEAKATAKKLAGESARIMRGTPRIIRTHSASMIQAQQKTRNAIGAIRRVFVQKVSH